MLYVSFCSQDLICHRLSILFSRLFRMLYSCARMIPAKTSPQPNISRGDSACPSSTQPASMANTDSILIRRDATTGSVSFWARICSVYPAPLDSTPA